MALRPQTSPPPAAGAATSRQLLAVAAEVFADRGYRDATVREICRRARANVAAIKYHFGDKQALYAAVLKETTPAPAAPAHADAAGLSPEQQLGFFIRTLLSRIAENGPDSLHSRIMAREMIEPTPALDRLVDEFIRPQYAWVEGLIRRMAGPGCTPAEVRDTANSVVSQVLFYKHCDAVLFRLHGGNTLDAARIDRLAKHITGFCIAGIRSLANCRPRATTPNPAPGRRGGRRAP